MGALDDLESEYRKSRPQAAQPSPSRPEGPPGFVEAGALPNEEKDSSGFIKDSSGSIFDVFKPFAENIENMNLARTQDVRPDVLDYGGSYAHEPIGEAYLDENDLVSFKDPSGQFVQANKKDHVVLRDPRTGNLTVFRRNPEWNEGNFAQAVRAISQGMLTGPVAGIQRGAQGASAAKQAIAANRATEATRDLQAFENLDVRPFGPAFSNGPVMSVAKQLSETPFVGGPVKNALDESISGTARAVDDIAGRMSPVTAHNEMGSSVQRGLQRFGTAGLDDLEPGVVQGFGIDPRAPVPRAQVMSQGAARSAQEAAPLRAQYGSDVAETTRGVQRPAAAPLGQVLTTRTSIEAVPDEQLAAIVRAPASDTSFATRAEALYERAWRFVPTIMRSNETANPNMIPATNTRRALAQIDAAIANDISGQTTLTGPLADRIRNRNAANFPLSDLRAIRTEIGRALSNTNPLKQTLDRSQLKALYGGISQDIEVGLETLANRAAILAREGGDAPHLVDEARRAANALRAFRTADRYFRQGVGSIERFHKVLGADTPEIAARRLIAAATGEGRGDLGMIQAAHSALRPEEWNDVAAVVLRSLGTPNPSARDAAKEFGFSVQTFLTNWRKMDPRARAMLFGGEHAGAIEDVARVVERLADVESKLNTSRSATNALNVGTAATVGASMYAGLDSLLMSGAGLGGLAGLSYLMSRPSYARWMANYLQMRGAGTVPQAHGQLIAHINRLREAARLDPQLIPITRAIAKENGIEETGDDQPSQEQELRGNDANAGQGEKQDHTGQDSLPDFDDPSILEGESMTPPMPRRARGGVADEALPNGTNEGLTGRQPPPLPPWVSWAQENYDPALSDPRDQDSWRPFDKPKPQMQPIPQEDKDRLREMLRQERLRLERDYPERIQELPGNRPGDIGPGSNLDLGSPPGQMASAWTSPQFPADLSFGAGQGFEEGGPVRKPYDYTPEDEFTNVDLGRYVVGRGLRRDATAGLGNRATAEAQAYKQGRPVEDILREYRDADRAYEADYPIGSTIGDTVSAVAGGVLGGGALKGTGSLGQRLMQAPHMFQTPLGMATAAGAASLGDTALNEPDATSMDYLRDAAISAGATMPMMMGLGALVDPVLSAVQLKDRAKGALKSLGDPVEAPKGAGDWHGHDLSKPPAPPAPKSPAGEAPAPFEADTAVKPKVYQKPADQYYPDMPNTPAIDIQKPKGTGYVEPPRSQRDAEFFTEAYETEGLVPEHISRIRKNSIGQHINEKGQYIPLSDAQIFENLKKKGLLGKLGTRRNRKIEYKRDKPKGKGSSEGQ